MTTSLAAIRARLAEQENKAQNQVVRQGDNAIFPHWNIAEGTSCTLRFLPDGNPDNSFFWVERQVIKLPFNGVIGGDNRRVEVNVPCVEMYGPGEQCPILAEVRPWYKDDSLKETANKYWKKRSYLFQGFVRVNTLADDKPPENPIRRFVISSQIFNVIKASLMDPEMENLPTDYLSGLDFKVTKTNKGGYADYSTSSWSRKETPLNEAEQAAIESFGLYNLNDFLPKKPNEAELRIIKEMFEASVDGQQYDPERWGAYYKPYGLKSNDEVSAPTVNTVSTVREPSLESDEPSITEVTPVPQEPVSSGNKAQDILDMIRNRPIAKS